MCLRSYRTLCSLTKSTAGVTTTVYEAIRVHYCMVLRKASGFALKLTTLS